MESRSRNSLEWISCLGLTALLLTGIIGLAQPQQGYDGLMQGEPMMHEPMMGAAASEQRGGCPDLCVPVELLLSGRGFAIKDNESWVFRLNIERMQPIEPRAIIFLLASNRTLEEISEEIRAKDGGATYRGSMKLHQSIYPLVNINVADLADNATVDADVAAPAFNSFNSTEPSTAGHITLQIALSEGSLTGKGELTMTSGSNAGRYRVLLEMMPAAREMRMRGAWR